MTQWDAAKPQSNDWNNLDNQGSEHSRFSLPRRRSRHRTLELILDREGPTPSELVIHGTQLVQKPGAASQTALKAHASEAKDWLFNAALPLWWEAGFDRASQCFVEALSPEGRPLAIVRRVRVQARQTFVYVAAGRLGWNGPWRDAANAGAEVLIKQALREDGGTNHLLGLDGRPHDRRRDLYDAAFVIFALAHAGRALQRRDLITHAEALTDWTFANWAHPLGGLTEGEAAPTPPRRQNPHMHMLEALLALYEATGEARHLARARDIVTLLRTRFTHPSFGAVLEYFNDDWTARAGEEGRITEPGHQFEWAWLLDRYRRHSGEDVADAAQRLHAHGEAHGINAAGYAVDETLVEGAVRTASSRLWPHTERLKANIVRYENNANPADAAAAIQANEALKSYLNPRGLWRDRRSADGAFTDEPAPASSFYHIMLAYSELIRVADAL